MPAAFPSVLPALRLQVSPNLAPWRGRNKVFSLSLGFSDLQWKGESKREGLSLSHVLELHSLLSAECCHGSCLPGFSFLGSECLFLFCCTPMFLLELKLAKLIFRHCFSISKWLRYAKSLQDAILKKSHLF